MTCENFELRGRHTSYQTGSDHGCYDFADRILTPWTRAKVIDIQGRSQTSYTAPCNGIVSHGLKFGVFKFLPTTHAKTNTKPMRLRSSRTVRRLRRVIFSRSDRSRCRWHTHLTNCSYFDYGKTWRPPICRVFSWGDWGPPSSENFANPPPSNTCPRFWTKACPPPAEVCPRKFEKFKYIFVSNFTTFKLRST